MTYIEIWGWSKSNSGYLLQVWLKPPKNGEVSGNTSKDYSIIVEGYDAVRGVSFTRNCKCLNRKKTWQFGLVNGQFKTTWNVIFYDVFVVGLLCQLSSLVQSNLVLLANQHCKSDHQRTCCYWHLVIHESGCVYKLMESPSVQNRWDLWMLIPSK